MSVFKCPLFVKTTVLLDQGPTQLQYDLTLTNCRCNDSISKLGHILNYRGLGLQHGNWREVEDGDDRIQPKTVAKDMGELLKSSHKDQAVVSGGKSDMSLS